MLQTWERPEPLLVWVMAVCILWTNDGSAGQANTWSLSSNEIYYFHDEQSVWFMRMKYIWSPIMFFSFIEVQNRKVFSCSRWFQDRDEAIWICLLYIFSIIRYIIYGFENSLIDRFKIQKYWRTKTIQYQAEEDVILDNVQQRYNKEGLGPFKLGI